MITKRMTSILLILIIFSLSITGCATSQKPNNNNDTITPQEEQNNTSTDTNNSDVQNDATVNDKSTMDNAMPDQPKLATPNSDVGLTLNQLNEFELDIELINNDKVDMKYKKGPSNEESKIETVLDGKKSNAQHEEASRQIEIFLDKIPGESIANANKIIEGTLSALKIKREDVTDFDMEFILESGEKVHIEFNK